MRSTGSKVRQLLFGLIGVAVALGLWQFAALGPLASSPLPTATASISEAIRLLGTPEMWLATGDTVYMALVGLAIATVVGVILGLLTGISPLIMHATRVPIEFLKPIPPIVILPVVVLVLGPTMNMGIFLVIFGCFIAVSVQTSAGVFDTNPVAKATGRSYGLNEVAVVRHIVLPSALPYVGTAIRVAAPTALIIAVVAGLLGGGPGLGRSLLLSQLAGNQVQLFAYVLILGVLGLIFQGLSTWGERKLLHWHPQYRKESQ